MSTSITPKTKKINRAEIVDANFIFYVQHFPESQLNSKDYEIDNNDLLELFESQLASRHLDFMAREMRLQNKVFYTIGSSGHEGNVVIGRLTRHTDPAFLHYRSGGFMAERSRKLPDIDFIKDTALSFAASKSDPASGGRHKVWGSKPLWVLPQTSTIASHLPKAVGTALAIASSLRFKHSLPIPGDSIVVCNFGDASSNHSTAQGAFNTAQWTAYQKLPLPILFICEDNNWGISVKTPNNWIEQNFSNRPGMKYFATDGCNIVEAYQVAQQAINYCRERQHPVFLHMKMVRLLGHAGTDFEIDYRSEQDLNATENCDPLLTTAKIILEQGIMQKSDILDLYEKIRKQCNQAILIADKQEKHTTLKSIIEPLANYSKVAVNKEAKRYDYEQQRLQFYGNAKLFPENQPSKHLAIHLNNALRDLLIKYPESLIFGEDVAQKGGVYTITKKLHRLFKSHRVFNTLLDEQTILGLAQGFANMEFLPIPEIQYLAYFHNACDQIRGEASSLSFFSNGQFKNPMVIRIAGLGYQKGFGGHFHNDNSFTALRDIPGVIIACPSRGDDAASMLRTCMAMAKVDGRVVLFLEPIALYMTKDLYQVGDSKWLFPYPAPDTVVAFGEERVYFPEANDLLIITYGNGVPMSLKAINQVKTNKAIRMIDLRWLQPLNTAAIIKHASQCKAVLVVDEGRESGGIYERIVTELSLSKIRVIIERVVGSDCFTPLGDAAKLVLPSEQQVIKSINNLLKAF